MKYVLAVFGVILVIVLAVVLVSKGDKQPKPPAGQQGNQTVKVSEQNRESTTMQFTEQGKLVGEDERRAIRIVVTQKERRLEILTGYEEAVERAQVYPNTPTAYETFLKAVDFAGFSRQRKAITTDEDSVCPLGRRYIYELKEFSQNLIRSWNTTCGKKYGTFGGDGHTIRTVFQEQIPDYTKQVKDVKLQ